MMGMTNMTLKPQDVLVVLKLVAMAARPWLYASLAVELGMSPSQLHAAVKRALQARLLVKREGELLPDIRNLEEFLVHGLKYVFVPEMGEMSRGMPTGYAASPLDKHLVQDNEPPPVWPDPMGTIRGYIFSPLYKLAPGAAQANKQINWTPSAVKTQHAQCQTMKLVTGVVELGSLHAYIDIIDHGKGFDLAINGDAAQGRGVKNMHHRAEQIGAQLQVTSSDAGTRVRLLIALETS